jgi:CubicO group peptidase (beta-lactamase class C family)
MRRNPFVIDRCLATRASHGILRSLVVSTLLLFGALLSGDTAAAQTDPTPEDAVYPGAGWLSIARDADALETYGWSPRELRLAWEFIRDSAHTTGLVVVDRGRIVFQFGDVEELSYLASVRKSVLAMLYGKYVEDGTIDLEMTLEELGMDDVGGLLDIEKRATIHHLITARSGVYHPASNGGDNLADAPERGSREPGEYMLYSNWDFNAAGAVFEQETGVDIYDSLEEQLAIPLGFQDWDRSVQRKSGNLEISRNPAYHMWISTRDMARIGYLMLRQGRWRDEQIISPAWVRRITSVVTPLDEMNPVRRRDGYFGYGYMWWVWDGPRAVGPFQGAYTARGAVGQWITVMPAVDLVIAHKTNSVYSRTTRWGSWQRFMEMLLEAKNDLELDGPYPWR